MSKGFTSLKRNCPICLGVRSDCRQSIRTKFIHCRDEAANPVDYVFLRQDKLGFGIWACRSQIESSAEQQRQEWQRSRELERQHRLLEEARQRAQLLPEAGRDRQIRHLLEQLTINQTHRTCLRARGLSERQIDAGMFRSVERWQKLNRIVSHRLAGVNISGTGLTNFTEGYLCPIWNEKQLIIGWQQRLDNPENGGKYRWPTSASKKRPQGPTAHLQNGELPLTYCKPLGKILSQAIYLPEGILKSWITAQKRGVISLGAAGGNFASSPQTFKRYLDAASAELNGSKLCVIPADAGALDNLQVMQQYLATAKLARTFGYEVRVGWWGQTSKDAPDIDELPPETEIEIISLAEFLKLGRAKIPLPKLPGEISRQEWLGLKTYNTFCNLFKEVTEQFLPQQKAESQPIGSSLAIVRYRGVSTIDYVPGELPSFERWLEMGQPKIVFQAGQRRQLNVEAYEKGYKATLDRSLVGYGKSHDSGLYTRCDFNLVQKDEQGLDMGGRIFVISSDHKNPTTETVERNNEDLISRHDGETLDYSRRTPLGKPYRIRTPKGEQPDILGNCPETNTFIIASEEKDVTIFGGKNSPICQRCSLFSNCEFLNERHRQLKAKNNIRAHIDSLGTVSHKDIGIVDEPDTLLKTTKTLIADIQDIEAVAFKLQRRNFQAYGLISTVLCLLADALAALRGIPQYGLSHADSLAALAGSEADKLQLEIWKRYQKLGESFEHPLAVILRAKLEEAYPSEDAWSTPGIPELESQIAVALNNNWEEILEGCQTPDQKQNAILTRAVLNWLSPLIKVINGQDKYTDIQINHKRELKITRRSYRHRHTLSSFGFVMFLDGTIAKSDLVRRSGINQILEIEQKIAADAFKNLKFRVVKGVGKNPKGTTAETTWQRTNAAVKALIQKTLENSNVKEEQIALIGFKGELKSFEVSDRIAKGYWFKDSRGNNRFEHIRHLIVFGLPKPNLSDKAAEWHALTGQIVDPTSLQGGYGNWYDSQVKGEIVQISGRPRAHLKPEEAVEVTFLAGDAMSDRDLDILKQKFPGCRLEIIDAYNLSPAAATKGVQKARRMVQAAWEMVQAGITPKVEQLAKVLNVGKSRISQLIQEGGLKSFTALVDSLVFLYNAIKGKTKFSQLDENVRWVADAYLPAAAKDLENLESVDKDNVVDWVVTVIQTFHAPLMRGILAATPVEILSKLFASLMRVVIDQLTTLPETG